MEQLLGPVDIDAIVIIGMTLIMLAVMLIASMRSQQHEVKAACALDVLIEFGCAF
ncbi:MAG: hypothetical protein PHT38_02435 [Halothiobacillus sp.]|jgi:hypothetical protein|nr:hypothetical protein [Halothiobacillus sp.]